MKIQGHPNICSCLGCFDAYRPGTSQAQYIMSRGKPWQLQGLVDVEVDEVMMLCLMMVDHG